MSHISDISINGKLVSLSSETPLMPYGSGALVPLNYKIAHWKLKDSKSEPAVSFNDADGEPKHFDNEEEIISFAKKRLPGLLSQLNP